MKATAAGWDVLRRPKSGVVVLIYHRVGRRSTIDVDLPLDLFDEQVAALAASGRVVTLDNAVAMVRGELPAPSERPVVLTFDDGTADWADVVLPVLVKHDVPATFYVATQFVDEQHPFPHDGAPISWQGLTDMASTGLATIGSHTHTHALLDRADAATAADELDRSVELIEDRLAVPCRHFCYPKALAGSPAAEAEVRRRFVSATLAGNRPNPYGGSDLHRLSRTAVQASDGMRWFDRKAAGGMALEGWLRERASGRRYEGATT